MMRMNNVRMTTTVPRDVLLEKLRTNLEGHARIVAEARAGYLERAQRALTGRLEDLKAGRLVHLQFNLTPPQDISEVYRTTIKMLELTTQTEVVLGADEFRQLVEDKWDWTDSFLAVNKMYSATAARLSDGGSADEPVGAGPG